MRKAHHCFRAWSWGDGVGGGAGFKPLFLTVCVPTPSWFPCHFFSPVSPLPGVLDLAVPKVSIRAISPKELCGDSTQEKPNLSYFQAFT